MIMQITAKNMPADKIQPNAVENLGDDYSENYYDSGVQSELLLWYFSNVTENIYFLKYQILYFFGGSVPQIHN